MLKQHYIKILFAITILFLGSCKDWLYLEPENGIVRDDFWKSKDDVQAAMMGCYASLLGNTSGNSNDIPTLLFIWGEMRADWTIPNRLTNYDYYNVYIDEIYPDNGLCRWDAFYRTINYCNTLLHYAPGVMSVDPSFTEDLLKEYEAEALALRALMYFYLVRTFKEVPLKLEATTSDQEEVNLAKSSSDEILKKIKTDLLTAEQFAAYTYGDVESDKARITKYTVNAIQSDVYLWCEQYDSTVIACNKIVNSGVFGLVEGDDQWFENLYYYGNSVEGIFELPFSLSKQNPYYSMFKTTKYLKASATTIEEFFPYDADAPVDSFDLRSDGCSYLASDNYTIWKYIGLNREEERSSSESYANFIVYRYAEILLNKAEALNQLGYSEEALKLVKKIRKRANASKIGDLDVTDRIPLGEYILNERAREFAFEGKRWFDLLRNARRNNYERLDLIIQAVSLNAPSTRQVTILNKYRDTLSHYLPIYIDEIEDNPNLVQNPYYEY